MTSDMIQITSKNIDRIIIFTKAGKNISIGLISKILAFKNILKL